MFQDKKKPSYWLQEGFKRRDETKSCGQEVLSYAYVFMVFGVIKRAMDEVRVRVSL